MFINFCFFFKKRVSTEGKLSISQEKAFARVVIASPSSMILFLTLKHPKFINLSWLAYNRNFWMFTSSKKAFCTIGRYSSG